MTFALFFGVEGQTTEGGKTPLIQPSKNSGAKLLAPPPKFKEHELSSPPGGEGYTSLDKDKVEKNIVDKRSPHMADGELFTG